jgi:hypothetical protein
MVSAVGARLTNVRFSPSIMDIHKKYYLHDLDANEDDYLPFTNETTWRRLIIWNVPEGAEYIAEIKEVFGQIGGFNRIERLRADKYGDDAPVSIVFNTWNVNVFTERLVDELDMCDIHNQHVSSYDKHYVTLFYEFDDMYGEREVFLELSWETDLVDIANK